MGFAITPILKILFILSEDGVWRREARHAEGARFRKEDDVAVQKRCQTPFLLRPERFDRKASAEPA